jgi:hypothetical protein
MNVEYDESHKVVPAMPDDPFEFILDLIELFRVNTPTNHRRKAMATKWAVNKVPIKPDAKRIRHEPWRQAIQGENAKVQHMFPDQLIAINIGSNKGLGQIMRDFYESKKQHMEDQCKQYTAYNADIQIFHRMYKVRITICT